MTQHPESGYVSQDVAKLPVQPMLPAQETCSSYRLHAIHHAYGQLCRASES